MTKIILLNISVIIIAMVYIYIKAEMHDKINDN
jgi:hypothetical protein